MADINLTAIITVQADLPAADASLIQYVNPGKGLPWSKMATELDITARAPWAAQARLDAALAAAWSETSEADADTALSWGRTAIRDVDVILSWSKTLSADPDFMDPWSAMAFSDVETAIPWSMTLPMDPSWCMPWSRILSLDPSAVLAWAAQDILDVSAAAAWSKTRYIDPFTAAPWVRTIPLDVSTSAGNTDEILLTKQPVFSQASIPWRAVARMIMNKQNIIFKRVSDDAEVHILNGSASIDIDSWAWSFSGVLPSKADADLVRPGADGSREVEVYLSVNGYVFKFNIRDVAENYRWAKGTYSFAGHSGSVVLAAPYCPAKTAVYGVQPVQQIIADELEGTGWTWDWRLIENTWNLAAGDLSVTDATKMDVIRAIVSAAGGTIQTHPSEKTLILQSRAPVSSWEWGAADPDETILSGVMSQARSADPQPGYNQVIVSGKNTGVIATIRKTGTAGEVSAPEIIDPLVTVQAVNEERGRVELSETWSDFMDETLVLPLPGPAIAPHLLFPGDLAEVTDLFSTWRGQVIATEVFFETAKTRQRVKVKRLA